MSKVVTSGRNTLDDVLEGGIKVSEGSMLEYKVLKPVEMEGYTSGL